MKLTIFIGPWHRAHSSGSTCQMRLSRAAIGDAARFVVVVDLDDVAPLAVGLGSQAAGLVRVPAEVAD
jgi:hypothetical protein